MQDGKGLQGAQAEYVRVPLAKATLVPVPEGVTDEQARPVPGLARGRAHSAAMPPGCRVIAVHERFWQALLCGVVPAAG